MKVQTNKQGQSLIYMFAFKQEIFFKKSAM